MDGLDHFVENCRASYSNFGDYVNITAPGTDIYSTQPWKKDFYEHRYFGADSDLTGYEFYSGTSMAAPHVAAVAARVFGNNVKFTNLQVAHRLLVQGYSSSVGPTSNVDVDGDGTDEITECWESGFTPPTPLGMTPFLADVNAATALGRGRVTGRLMDATTGLGLNGATAQLLKGTAIVGYGGLIETAGSSFFDIINVPWNDQGTGILAPPYKMRVRKAGYTWGIVEDYVAGDAQKPGISLDYFDVEHSLRQVSVPPLNANYVFVTDWGTWDSGTYAAATELDQYLFLPIQAVPPGDFGCTVGFDLLTGDCGDPGPTGSLLTYPWARWMRDGGPCRRTGHGDDEHEEAPEDQRGQRVQVVHDRLPRRQRVLRARRQPRGPPLEERRRQGDREVRVGGRRPGLHSRRRGDALRLVERGEPHRLGRLLDHQRPRRRDGSAL